MLKLLEMSATANVQCVLWCTSVCIWSIAAQRQRELKEKCKETFFVNINEKDVQLANYRQFLVFRRIPANHEIQTKWLAAINHLHPVTKKPCLPSRYDVLCSDHSKPDDFKPSRHGVLQLLKPGVVPSVFAWGKDTKVSIGEVG